MPAFYAIAAMSENRVIGNQGKIPWHLPEDFRWFKHKTMGSTLVMGRKTFESIGKPLPGRKTVVLTPGTLPVPNIDICSTLIQFDNDYLKAHPGQDYWICGGGTIYTQFLDRCSYLYLTIVKREVEGDVFFPSPSHLQTHHEWDQLIHENAEFRVERWKHKTPVITLPHESWPFPSAQA